MAQHPEYWKVKSAFLTAQKARLEAEQLVTRSEAQLGFVMKMAGLDPQVSYELNDQDETITEREKAASARVAMSIELAGVIVATLLVSSCAAKAVWLDRQPVIDDYTTAHVRIYRAGRHCRLEVITPTDTIVTLPTQCLTVPHITRP